MNDSDFNPRKRHVVFQKLNITPSSMPIISLIASIKNVRANGLDLSPTTSEDTSGRTNTRISSSSASY